MQAYRLVDVSENELIFGVDNLINNASLEKLAKGVAKIRPYNQAVPYYKNTKFAFISFNAFKYFLFEVCQLTYDDLIELEKLGYKVINEELECYSRGLSKILCTHFDNEIVELKTELLSELFDNADSMKYDTIYQPILPKEIIKECKDQFYKNVKFMK